MIDCVCNDCNISSVQCGHLMYSCRRCWDKQWCMRCGKKYATELILPLDLSDKYLEISFDCPLCNCRTITLSIFNRH